MIRTPGDAPSSSRPSSVDRNEPTPFRLVSIRKVTPLFFSLFGMDCEHNTGLKTNKKGSASAAWLTRGVFGNKLLI
jgi:hypothetical protein